jgi:hypothetical protein
MYPGPNDTDWQVAQFQHRELVHKGQRQQVVARALSATADPCPPSTAVRPRLGTHQQQAIQRLLDLHSILTQCLTMATTGKRAAVV